MPSNSAIFAFTSRVVIEGLLDIQIERKKEDETWKVFRSGAIYRVG
jgi:hypothetical protein